MNLLIQDLAISKQKKMKLHWRASECRAVSLRTLGSIFHLISNYLFFKRLASLNQQLGCRWPLTSSWYRLGGSEGDQTHLPPRSDKPGLTSTGDNEVGLLNGFDSERRLYPLPMRVKCLAHVGRDPFSHPPTLLKGSQAHPKEHNNGGVLLLF